MNYFNPYALIPFSALILTILASGYTLGRIENRQVSYAFFLLAVDVAFWQASEFFAYLSKPFITPLPANISLREFSDLSLFPLSHTDRIIHTLFLVDSVFWLSIGFIFLNLTYIFLNRKKDIYYVFTLLILLVSILIHFFTDWIIGSRPIPYNWGADVIRGPLLAPFTVIVVVLPVIYAIVLLLKRRRQIHEEIYRKQLVMLSISVG